jgi:phage terminase large subunit GpA-like protein
VQDRERNEALDTAVLCLAAFKLLNPNIAVGLCGRHRARSRPPR